MAPIKLRGEGGGVWEYELPLSAVHAEQVANGKLKPADDDAAAALAAAAPSEQSNEPGRDHGDDGDRGEGTLAVEQLAKLKLAELIEYAKTHGVDEETVASFQKAGTSKAKVIEAIAAAAAPSEQ